ncbi:MAG TPA: YhdP family protein [Aliidiomarina sp.]|nr:YhdP family protein [Aliidiomarina sp.]
MKFWRALIYLINKLWLLLAVLLLTAALLLSAARFALPYLDYYRVDIESFVANKYGQEVEIGALNAKWTNRGPTLVLEEVALVTDDTLPFALQFGEVEVVLSFWQTLLGRQLVFEEFVLDDVVVELNLNKNVSSELPILDALERLLLQQLEHFEIRNSTLNLHTPDGRIRTISIEGLRWLNRDGTRQATGRFSVPDVTANHLNFIAKLDSKSKNALTGSLYVEASRLDISPWLTQLTHTAEIERAEFNLRGWLEFKNAQFVNGQVHFDENHLEWRRGEDSHSLTTSATTWLLTPQENGWLMNSEPLQVHIDGQVWPIAAVAWEYNAGGHLWNLDALEIGDFGPIWSLFGSPGEDVRQWSAGLKPHGNVKAFKARLTPQRDWQFYVAADDLSWQPYRGVPGISGLSFEFWSDADRGRFEITGQSVSLSSPSTFNDAQELAELVWLGFWERDEFGWSLRIPDARFSLPKADLIQDFRLSGGDGLAPTVEWSVGSDSRGMQALDALALLPLQLGESLAEYLHEAVKEGVLDELSMVWRGSLADFPYRAGEGVFQARASVSQLDFEFQPDWMPLEADHAVLQYNNETLHISADKATLGGIEATSVRVELPDLLSPKRWLHINATVSGEASAAHEVFIHSPLADSVGAALEQVVPSGGLAGAFRLSVPFFPEADFQARGEVNLTPQRIHLTAVNTDLDNVAGVLTFNNTAIEFITDSAEWHGVPVRAHVTGNTHGEGYQVNAEVSGAWTATHIAESFPTAPLLEHFTGELASRADFELLLDGAGGFTYDWSMRTDFTAIDSHLPAPFVKEPGEMWFWDTKVVGNEKELFIQSGVVDKIMFDGELTLGDETLNAVLVRVGPVVEAEMPTQGIAIHLASPELSMSRWADLWSGWEEQVAGLPTEMLTNSPSILHFLPKLEQMAGEVKRLDVWGQNFDSVHVDLAYVDGHWGGEVNAEQTRMTIDYAEYSDALRVTADFLELHKMEWGENDLAAEQRGLAANNWLEKIPPVDLVCRICRYDDKDLGRVTIGLDRRLEGEQLRHLRVLKSGTRLELSGGWQDVNGRLVSSLNGEFNTKNVSALLQEWGADSVVRDSETKFIGNLSWAGNLLELNRDSIDGEVKYAMGAGYLRDVSDGGARLLSVLSLESIVRKLTLDFRDIFARGMFYSSFTGTLTIDDGSVGTQNTEMIGSAGDLAVRGTTDLVTEELDYQLSYTPKVTSSLPVLLAWMINPPSGIAALVIDRVLHEAKVISRLQYQVTGTMSEPVVTEVQRDAKNVELPEEDLRLIEEEHGNND